MDGYIFRRACFGDIDEMMEIYDGARRFMAANGNPGQWVGGYPSREIIMADIERGVSYVMTDDDGVIYGAFSFIPGPDPTYGYIENGEWLNDEPYGTIHRIASAGRCCGFGRRVIEWCGALVTNLRADTHVDNAPMRRLLVESGFRECGTIYLVNGSPRLAFHKPMR